MRWLTFIIILVCTSPIHAQFNTIRRELPIQSVKASQQKQQEKEDVSEDLDTSSRDNLDAMALAEPGTLQCSLPLNRDMYITSAYGNLC